MSRVLALLIAMGPCAAPLAAASARPNVVFIMADDLGYGDLGVYGQEKIRTPRIDGLAAEGIRFTQAYAGATVCAPSRASLMTGHHGGHARIRDNLPLGVWLRPGDVTIAEVLKQAGYRTGGIGKWSLGEPGSRGIPLYQGFDTYFGHLSQDQAHFYYPDYLWDDEKVKLLHEVVLVDGVGKMQGNRGGANIHYTHDLFTERALSFIRENRERPFFLYLPYTIPHFSDYPRDTPEHFIVPSDEPYGGEDWPRIARNYAAMITRLDRDVGRILDLLAELDIEEETLVIFTSDNGSYQGSTIPIEFFDSNGPLRGGKRDLYEGGIRIPFIARWPGQVPAAEVSDHVFAFWDVMPTLAEVAGLPAPEGIDGISMLAALRGEPAPEHEYLYFDYGHRRPVFKQAIRTGGWKGVRVGARAPLELYDLNADPGEAHDVAAAHPGVVERIEGFMRDAFVPDENYRIRELEEAPE